MSYLVYALLSIQKKGPGGALHENRVDGRLQKITITAKGTWERVPVKIKNKFFIFIRRSSSSIDSIDSINFSAEFFSAEIFSTQKFSAENFSAEKNSAEKNSAEKFIESIDNDDDDLRIKIKKLFFIFTGTLSQVPLAVIVTNTNL